MGLKATYEIVCEGCGQKVETVVVLDQEEEKDGISHTYLDIWGPGIPYGWLQTVDNKKHLFFHDQDCMEKWLIAQGRVDEAEELHNAIWIA
jgi:hypothetical protein